MGGHPLASVILSNYNCGHFLAQAVESALGQTYPRTEVIVVDDGSTDNSREVLADYRGRVQVLFKENGGQASALNLGLRASRGNAVVFLDADDLLLPTALEQALDLFADRGATKVHWPLWVIDERGRKTGEVCPDWGPLAEGDLREAVLRRGADGYVWPPTSGNCWSRAFLERVGPLPEAGNSVWPDFYLATLAPLYGPVHRLAEPQGLYRIHGGNYTFVSIESRLGRLRQQQDTAEEALGRHGRALDLRPDLDECRRHSWYEWLRQIHLATRDMAAFLAPRAPYILVDEATWTTRDLALPGRPIPFPEQDGQYGGRPPDDESALREFERLRATGAGYLVVGWPAFWWLEHYQGLNRRLRSGFRCVLENERVIIFDLGSGPPAGGSRS
jgi:glycosyltransferase involved in cell wall biosynthesis